jgi:hypothetical protein
MMGITHRPSEFPSSLLLDTDAFDNVDGNYGIQVEKEGKYLVRKR